MTCSAYFVLPPCTVEVNPVCGPIYRIRILVILSSLPRFINHQRSSRHFKFPTISNLFQGLKRRRIIPRRCGQPRKSFNVTRVDCERHARCKFPLKAVVIFPSRNIGNIFRHTESGSLEDTSQLNGKRLSLPPHVMQTCDSEDQCRQYEKRETTPTSILSS